VADILELKKMSSSWSIQAPTLVGSNYDFWSEKVKAILQMLYCVETWDVGIVLKNLRKKKEKPFIEDDSISPKIISAKTDK
jgi:hypothetical protein